MRQSDLPPYALITALYDLPFNLYPFQQAGVSELAPLTRSALYYAPGLGKTPTSTLIALFKLEAGAEMVIVLMPPLLITQWARWLSRIKRKDGRPLKVLAYRGTPAKRAAMSFEGFDFVLMGVQIFKKDIGAIQRRMLGKKFHVILDEAQCIKDVGTANYKTYRDFVGVDGRTHTLLTGTPLNVPIDAYAYIKLVSPGVYRTLAQFNSTHVEEVDFYDKPIRFRNLELLKSNLRLNADLKTKEEVLTHLPPAIIVPIEYELDPRHLALYRKLVTEKLLELPDEEKMDFTQVTALYHAVGQIVMQWSYFAQDDKVRAAGFDLIDAVLDELNGAKLVVFANYVRTNKMIVDRYGCPAIYGGISEREKEAALKRFIEDPACRLITLNPVAGGVGVDGLQHVCCDALYVEPPMATSHWTQSLSRVHREGQTKPTTIRMGVALGTAQVRLLANLSDKEALVNPLQGMRANLKEALFGQ